MPRPARRPRRGSPPSAARARRSRATASRTSGMWVDAAGEHHLADVARLEARGVRAPPGRPRASGRPAPGTAPRARRGRRGRGGRGCAARVPPGTSMTVVSASVRRRLAASAASSRRCHSTTRWRSSTLVWRQNWSAAHCASARSKSSPPSQASPRLASTRKTSLADVEDGEVEGAAAEVVDRDQLVGALAEAVGRARRPPAPRSGPTTSTPGEHAPRA